MAPVARIMTVSARRPSSSLLRVSSPRLSVVLVVHRDQAYLRECVASVLGQPFRDVELLALDDASPDHAPELLDELGEGDERLVVRHLERALPIGEARNVALASARGEYVWFVETTDLLAEGALEAVAARLEETEPDLLVVDHAKSGALGPARPGPHGEVLRAAAGVGTFTLDDRPEALSLAPDLWNKVFRREFLDALGARFTPGGHSDLAVTYPALLTADRVAALARVAYERRRPPNAAADPHVHGTPFDVFAAYDAAFALAASANGARRDLLPVAMLRHYLVLLAGLPAPSRRDFFARAHESYVRHARGGERVPVPLELPIRLARAGRYGALETLRRAGEGRRRAAALRRLPKAVRRPTRASVLRRYYRAQLRRPIDPELAVFAAYWSRGYSCNPRAIYEKLRELVPSVRGVWVVGAEHAATLPDGLPHVVAGTREYYRLLARARYFVNNVNFPNEFVKRPGTIHVQTHHGTPLKKMGLDLRDAFYAGKRMNFELLLRRCARWDYSVSSNVHSTLVWERVYPTRYETLEVGYPRNDALANATEDDVRRIRAELGVDRRRRVILYAPTHREYRDGFEPTLELGRVAEDLGPDYVILARLHYFYGRDSGVEELHDAGRVVDVARHPSIEELCVASDALVTDYSALMFDYAVLDRPIVVHAPDWDEYRTLRGTYFDLLAEPPGVVTSTHDELVDAFRSRAAWSDEASALRAAFRGRFCSWDDGRAAERVVRRVWLGEDVGPPTSAAPAPAVARPCLAPIEA